MVMPVPPEQATFSALPRITPVSWQAWCSSTGSAGSPDGSKRRYDADAGLASGTCDDVDAAAVQRLDARCGRAERRVGGGVE